MSTLTVILYSAILGFICRLSMLKIDYRNYPSYPQSLFSHLMIGAIASLLGGVFLPALINEEYTAVTFLTLAASQFREIRSMERDALIAIEEDEMVKRGSAYIEDIARKFESRNYASMLVAFVSSVLLIYVRSFNMMRGMIYYLILMVVLIAILNMIMKSKPLSKIAKARLTDFYFEDQILTIEGVALINIGFSVAKEKIMREAVAIMIEPKNNKAQKILANLGQRQAIINNLYAKVGIKKDIDEVDFTPIVRIEGKSGSLVMIYMPLEKEEKKILDAVNKTSVLESAKN